MRFTLYAYCEQIIPSKGKPFGWLGPWREYATLKDCEQAMAEHWMKAHPQYKQWKIIDSSDNSTSIYGT